MAYRSRRFQKTTSLLSLSRQGRRSFVEHANYVKVHVGWTVDR